MSPAGAVPVAADSRASPALAWGALLVLITAVAYLPALGNGFIWDDDDYVTANAALLDLAGLSRIWLEPGAVPQYYPLTFTSLWLEYQLWGLEPFGYHLVNVLLHGLAALLFWRVLRLLEVPGAWLAAAIFALHPIHVESVAWITERKNVLSGACYLGAAFAYLRFSLPRYSEMRPWRWYVLALLLFIAALLSKTVTATLPAALLLVLCYRRERFDTRALAPLAPMLILGLAAATFTAWMEKEHVGAQGAEWSFSLIEHMLIAGRILWFYLWTLVWPANLTFIYPRWQIDAGAWWQYLFPLAALVAVAALVAWRRRLGTGALTAVLLYAGTLIPALGFFNVYPMRYSFVADHFAYLATLGPIALAAALAARLVERVGGGVNAARLHGGAALLVLALITGWQSTIYRDPETLWTDTVAKNPDGWMPRLNLGGVLADQGRLDEAIAHMETAVRTSPGSPEAHNALGALWDQQGELDQAVSAFRRALELEPRYYEAYTNLGIVLASQGKLEEAAESLSTAIRLKPQFAIAHYHLGTTLADLGRDREAARSFANGLLAWAEHAESHNGLCAVLTRQGRLQDAARHCQEAIRLKQDFPEAHENLARVLRVQGRSDEARGPEESAARLRHELSSLHRNAGMTLSQQGKPRAAIAHLREALRFHPDDAIARSELERLYQPAL